MVYNNKNFTLVIAFFNCCSHNSSTLIISVPNHINAIGLIMITCGILTIIKTMIASANKPAPVPPTIPQIIEELVREELDAPDARS